MPGAAPVKNEQETQARLTRDEERTQRRVDAPRSPIRPERVGTAEGRGDEAGD